MKHIHLLLVALAISSGSLLAQTTIAVQGSLKKTTDRMPVDFANVLLRHPADSSLVVGTTTSDEHGAFRLEAPEGTFLLSVHRGFFCCRYFSTCNVYLRQHHLNSIEWYYTCHRQHLWVYM